MGCLSFAVRSSAFEPHNHRQTILCSCASCCYCHLSIRVKVLGLWGTVIVTQMYCCDWLTFLRQQNVKFSF